MTATLDSALDSCARLRGMLLDKQAGKVTPSILIREELVLLTKRINALETPEPVAFDLTKFRAAREADETPVGADGVAEESDEG